MVGIEARRNVGSPQRVETLLRLYDFRGSQHKIWQFYRLKRKIGEGNYGEVLRCTPKDDRKVEDVAVKHIKWDTVWGGFKKNPEQEEQVRRELKVLIALDNPFTIRVREWFEDPKEGIYFVMENCDGGTLSELLEDICELPEHEERYTLYEDRLRRHFREITYALHYLHSMDPPIAHCDLKPDNALLKTKDPGSSLKLIDFGLVSLKGVEEEDREKWTKGTQIFMAPEQFLQASGVFTTSMDVWALGVIFVWLMTALELGELQHPMLSEDEGKGYDASFLVLHDAFREVSRTTEAASWKRELFRNRHPIAEDLADKMLTVSGAKRWSLREISKHGWFNASDDLEMESCETFCLSRENIVMNLRMYPKLNRFERMLLNAVVDHCSARAGRTHAVIQELRSIFLKLDTAFNGRLSKQEILAGFQSVVSEDQDWDLEDEIDILFDTIGDLGMPEDASQQGANQSGVQPTLSYTEWLAVAIGHRALTSESLNGAFAQLDASLSGAIQRDDLVAAVGQLEAARVFAELGDPACISHDDFKKLAKRVCSKRWDLGPAIDTNMLAVSSIPWGSPPSPDAGSQPIISSRSRSRNCQSGLRRDH